jgi:hypothetical protein
MADKKDPRDKNIYTADKGQPPSPYEGPTQDSNPDPRDANIYTADKGQPPSPYEGPTKSSKTVKKAKGGMVGSASKRADGCAQRGKTRGRMV